MSPMSFENPFKGFAFTASNITTTGFYPWLAGVEEKEEHMSINVTTTSQVDNLKTGDRIGVRQDGTEKVVMWVADGKGGLSNDGSTLPWRAFEGAITNGNVFIPGDYKVGETFTDGSWIFKVIAVDGDGWVWGKTDVSGHAHSTGWTSGEPVGLRAFSVNRTQQQAFAVAEHLHAGDIALERLTKIMETGQVPDDVEYTVSVEVKGNVGVAPTEAQARSLVGDKKVQITGVGTTDVAYTKTVAVTKTSRWGCACAEVTAGDLDGEVPGEVTSWAVLDCAPKARAKAAAEKAPVTAA